ncbi:helix-turn-helix domain-containing protein [Tenacibaculum sp. nBUS_03]|uniref:helix-turn-helix domain-containing protein n=1 Tax=Tenacibaculum sp. nBUS_03 TaxID=3395320 RepID=UPI003EB69E99
MDRTATRGGTNNTGYGIVTRYKLHLNDIEELVFDSDKMSCKVDDCGVRELDFGFDHSNIQGRYREIITDKFTIGYGNGCFKNSTSIDFKMEGEIVEMHFTLIGSTLTQMKYFSEEFLIKKNQHNIFYGSDVEGRMVMAEGDMFAFEIKIKPDFFQQYIPGTDFFKNFIKIIENKEVGFMNKLNYPMTAEMHFIIHEIVNCKWKSKFRLLFLESKVLELLLLQIDQISSYKVVTQSYPSSKKIIDKMYYAKELITKRLDEPLRLIDLAKEVNTNECTLKKEFKSIFGTTVFGYIKDLKMEQAKKMLLRRDFSVSEVSDAVGYKNPQHFSTAFKRHFGYTPSMLLKK